MQAGSQNRLLSREELEGVMAHELAQVKNRDTLIGTGAATLARLVATHPPTEERIARLRAMTSNPL